MSKESWFANFERNLAENGWLDNMGRDDLYEEAGKKAFDDLRDREAEEAHQDEINRSWGPSDQADADEDNG